MYLSVNNLEAAQKTGKKQVIKTTRELTNQVPAPESMRGVKQYAAIATGYVNIPEDGVYYISSDLEEVWIDGKLMVNNGGEVKRFSRHDTSAAWQKACTRSSWYSSDTSSEVGLPTGTTVAYNSVNRMPRNSRRSRLRC